MPGPMPPQGQAPQGQEPTPDTESEDTPEQVVAETAKNLAALAQAAPPELQGEFGQISDAFQALVEKMMSGGAPKGPPAQGPGTPEAGGNPNARPAGF